MFDSKSFRYWYWLVFIEKTLWNKLNYNLMGSIMCDRWFSIAAPLVARFISSGVRLRLMDVWAFNVVATREYIKSPRKQATTMMLICARGSCEMIARTHTVRRISDFHFHDHFVNMKTFAFYFFLFAVLASVVLSPFTCWATASSIISARNE